MALVQCDSEIGRLRNTDRCSRRVHNDGCSRTPLVSSVSARTTLTGRGRNVTSLNDSRHRSQVMSMS
ncbi:hypothetical protein KCU92_g275, partial [Aureobasidium melanogenum]